MIKCLPILMECSLCWHRLLLYTVLYMRMPTTNATHAKLMKLAEKQKKGRTRRTRDIEGIEIDW
jgi:hypothetical protein